MEVRGRAVRSSGDGTTALARAQTAERWLSYCSVLVMIIGAALDETLARYSPNAADSSRVFIFGCFYLTIVARLVLAAVTQPRRRRPVLFLLGSVLLWAVGSTLLNATARPDLTRFPSPGEWFFLASYFGMAVYLVIDSARGNRTSWSTWLEAIVICGGTACLAETLLLTPLSNGLDQHGVAQLLALLYPLIDLVLAVVVVGQAVLRVGGGLRNSIMRCAGFVLFAIADISFVQNLQKGTYSFGVLDDTFWGVGFSLIVGAACRSSRSAGKVMQRRQGAFVMVTAALIATVVLAFRPTGDLAGYVIIPALLTLAAAGGRLALALREANGAAEAILLSRTDDLTMLPNRRAVLARLDEGLLSDGPLALMMLDLDGFKEVNDTLGHAAGDTVLQFAAMRMRDALPPDVLIGRLGGDEFAVVVTEDDPMRLLDLGETVLEALGQPTIVDGIELTTNGSVGITVRAGNDRVSTDILRRADVAMYQSKVTRSGALLYDADRDDFSRNKLQLAEQLRRGILEGQLTLWYQPQIEAATQQVCGLEALVRWEHPEQGLLSPAVFLPAARRAGLMLLLSEMVSKLAVADVKRWSSQGLRPRVAVNCAPPEMLSGIFLPRLFEMIRRAQLPPESIVIEITEDSFLSDPERTRTILSDIRDHGLQIAIDDYGTGFSSLSYLRDLPVQELKMDRSFISTLRTDPRNRMIVESTFHMAHALGLRMVAEGVEDAATAADLVAMGVDVLQGYHLARPMPSHEVADWMRRWAPLSDNGIGSLDADPGAA
jgi:diguanylate cyclase (GGDEF)-like protein